MTPYFETESGVLYHGDCLEVMKQMPDNSVTSCISDPPYGLGEIKNLSEVLMSWCSGGDMSANKKDFMGKDWELPSPVIWKEVIRILKPGGTALVFAGTRSFDLMAISMRLAGFEIKDSIWHGHSAPFLLYTYGSGFPKSANISKNICKGIDKRKALSEKWKGYHSHGLKPAVEVILCAMKPNDGTYAENAIRHGVSGLNIDGCRIGTSKDKQIPGFVTKILKGEHSELQDREFKENTIYGEERIDIDKAINNCHSGRYPSNLLLSHHPECVCEDETIGKWTCHTDCIVGQMNERAGVRTSGDILPHHISKESENCCMSGKNYQRTGQYSSGSSGYVSRYFKQFAFDPERLLYSGKSSRKERDAGCEGLEEKQRFNGGLKGCSIPIRNSDIPLSRNNHPTVKSLKIMQYLSLLTRTPNDGGIVFDPFAGSGSTLVAAINTNRRWIGIEREAEYCAIAKSRIEHAEKQHKQTELDFKGKEDE